MFFCSLMAQHKIGERVRPESVLECVKKHRLFPQAEASIRLQIPTIQKFHLGIEVGACYRASLLEQSALLVESNIFSVWSPGSKPVCSHGGGIAAQWVCWRRAGLGVSARRLHVSNSHHRVPQPHGNNVARCREVRNSHQQQVWPTNSSIHVRVSLLSSCS